VERENREKQEIEARRLTLRRANARICPPVARDRWSTRFSAASRDPLRTTGGAYRFRHGILQHDKPMFLIHSLSGVLKYRGFQAALLFFLMLLGHPSRRHMIPCPQVMNSCCDSRPLCFRPLPYTLFWCVSDTTRAITSQFHCQGVTGGFTVQTRGRSSVCAFVKRQDERITSVFSFFTFSTFRLRICLFAST
jgi:hypothetical protein